MMNRAELKLIGDFVNASLAAGLVRTVEGAAAVSHITNAVRREIDQVERFERMKMQGAPSLKEYTEWAKKDVSDATLYSSKPIDTTVGSASLSGLCAPQAKQIAGIDATAGSASISGCSGQGVERLDAFPRVG